MKKGIQRRKKEDIIAGILDRSQKCILKKAVKKTISKNFFRDLKPFAIVNAKNFPSEIVDALEKEYILVSRGYSSK